MAKVNDLMNGRNQGLLFALKVAKEGGTEALEKEIEFRNLTGVSLNISRKELEEATKSMRIRATEVAIVLSLITLLDEFYFSKSQAKRFKAVFDSQVDCILNDEMTLEDYLTRIKEELGIVLVVKD